MTVCMLCNKRFKKAYHGISNFLCEFCCMRILLEHPQATKVTEKRLILWRGDTSEHWDMLDILNISNTQTSEDCELDSHCSPLTYLLCHRRAPVCRKLRPNWYSNCRHAISPPTPSCEWFCNINQQQKKFSWSQKKSQKKFRKIWLFPAGFYYHPLWCLLKPW